MTIGALPAASPSRDGEAYLSSPRLDRRRLHPFVPETMLYESVPFRPVERDNKNASAEEEQVQEEGEEELDGDEADVAPKAALPAASSRTPDVPKKCVSTFTLLQRSRAPADPNAVAPRLALYDVLLGSGRSHQIRVHAADAGCPVLNDPYYNGYTVAGFLMHAAALRFEDAVAAKLRSKRGTAGRALSLEDIAEAAEEEAANALSHPDDKTFLRPLPPPAVPLMRTPLFPSVQTRRSSARTTATIAKGKMAKTRTVARAQPQPASDQPKRRIPYKYVVRQQRRSFATYAPRRLFSSTTTSSTGGEGSTPAEEAKSQKQRWTPDNFKRRSKIKKQQQQQSQRQDDDEDDVVLRRGRSSVGQGGAATAAAPAFEELDEFDDPSERRVLGRGGVRRPHSASEPASSNHQGSQQPPRGGQSAASSRRQKQEEEDEAETLRLFDHKVEHGWSSAAGMRSTKKITKSRASIEDATPETPPSHPGRPRRPIKGSAHVEPLPEGTRYTNRHEAPLRPRWLPEHVPYKYVKPSQEVDNAWKDVLGKYGVAPQPHLQAATAAAAPASTKALPAGTTGNVPAGDYTAATRYANDQRGAGAVGWLAKSDSSAASDPAALIPSFDSSEPGGEHHWFASQLQAPEHEMGLQAYFVRLPHPTRPGFVLTVQQELPQHWQELLDGKAQ